jgi:ATP/maltotriose-dependent transcriptional regulator MalT
VAALYRVQKQPDERVVALERAVEVFAGRGAAYLEVRALARLARTEAKRGDATAAEAAWARIEELYSAAEVPEKDRAYRRPAS